MIVQGCLNGARANDYHDALPITVEEIAVDGARCCAAGAAELHVHPRGPDGRESLASVDDAVRALRMACPGTLIGVSTGAWIEGDAARTHAQIAAWRVLPDHASVNLAEPDAPAMMALLDHMGIRIEAGLAIVADAERFATLPERSRVLRVLIEIEEQNTDDGDKVVAGIRRVLDHVDARRPILLHGVDAAVWYFVERAREWRWSTRIGLEDGYLRRDGSHAANNAELVREAVTLYRSGEPGR